MTAPFDTTTALEINEARRETLARVLDSVERSARMTLESAVDVGCGYGFFSRYLSSRGLRVTALDARKENVAETKKRNPGIATRVLNIEDPEVSSLGRFDLVFCFGLLYHLENPLLAMKHLEGLTGKVLVMESVIAPGRAPVARFVEEERAQNQGVNFVALVPTESWFRKSLYWSGFRHVYRSLVLPRHRDFHLGLLRRRRRTILVASHNALTSELLGEAGEPHLNPHLWDRPWVGLLVRSDRIRRSVKTWLGRFSVARGSKLRGKTRG